MDAQAQVAVTTTGTVPKAKAARAVFALQPLPYAENGLEPVISAKTLRPHYGKHYKGYVDTLNQLVAGTPFDDMSLKQIVLATAAEPEHAPIFHRRQVYPAGFARRGPSSISGFEADRVPGSGGLLRPW